MKSKFQREQRTRIVFQQQKRKAKVPNFQENSLAFQLGTVGNYWASWKLEWGFYGTFNGSAEGRRKKEEKGKRINSEYARVTPRSYYSLLNVI